MHEQVFSPFPEQCSGPTTNSAKLQSYELSLLLVAQYLLISEVLIYVIDMFLHFRLDH